MERPELMRMKITDLPPEFVALYKLNNITDGSERNVWATASGNLSTKTVRTASERACYRQSQRVWKHDTRPISFTLCVDDFGVKYVGREHAEHLKNVLNEHYKCAVDWDGKKYLGMDIDWDYDGRKVHVSMLDYIPEVLARL